MWTAGPRCHGNEISSLPTLWHIFLKRNSLAPFDSAQVTCCRSRVPAHLQLVLAAGLISEPPIAHATCSVATCGQNVYITLHPAGDCWHAVGAHAHGGSPLGRELSAHHPVIMCNTDLIAAKSHGARYLIDPAVGATAPAGGAQPGRVW